MLRKFIVILAWTVVAFIVFATLVPLGERPQITEDPNIERFAAFGLAGFLLGISYPRRFLWTVLFMVALAFILEALQRLTPDRHGHLSDMTVKAVGGLAGTFLAGLALRFWPLLRPKDDANPQSRPH